MAAEKSPVSQVAPFLKQQKREGSPDESLQRLIQNEAANNWYQNRRETAILLESFHVWGLSGIYMSHCTQTQ